MSCANEAMSDGLWGLVLTEVRPIRTSSIGAARVGTFQQVRPGCTQVDQLVVVAAIKEASRAPLCGLFCFFL